jgi:hypothetical protein
MSAPSKNARARITRRRVVVALVVVAAAAVVALALRPSPMPVEAVQVGAGPMMVTLDEDGETRVRDRYVVSAPLPGRVLRISLEPGDPVVANKTALATFLPMAPALLDARTRAELQARVAATEAALKGARAQEERTRAQLAQAERDVVRARELVDVGALAKERLESAELAVNTLKNAVDAALASVRTAEAELSMARASLLTPGAERSSGAPAIVLRSPIDGVVLRRLSGRAKRSCSRASRSSRWATSRSSRSSPTSSRPTPFESAPARRRSSSDGAGATSFTAASVAWSRRGSRRSLRSASRNSGST